MIKQENLLRKNTGIDNGKWKMLVFSNNLIFLSQVFQTNELEINIARQELFITTIT
jgi:hypothetical protein